MFVFFFFFFNDTATTEIYTLSLHDALPIGPSECRSCAGSRRTPTRPRCGRSARPRSGRGARRCSGSLRSVWVELPGEKQARRLEDLVRAAQLVVLLAQPADLLALRTRQQLRPLTAVGLGLAHLLAQRLRMHAQTPPHVRDRPLSLERDPHRPLHELVGILLRSSHGSGSLSARTATWLQGLRQIRDGSAGAAHEREAHRAGGRRRARLGRNSRCSSGLYL